MALRGITTSAPAAASTSNSITYAGASNIQVGDLILLISIQNPGGSGNTYIDPTGFTAAGSVNSNLADVFVNSSGYMHLAAKIATSADVGTPSYTTSVSTYSGYWVQQLRVYSGRFPSVKAALSNATVTAEAHVVTPGSYSFTGPTASAGDDVVAIVGFSVANGGSSGETMTCSISGFGNQAFGYNFTGTTFPLPLASFDSLNVSAGAVGTLAAAISGSNGAQDIYCDGWVIAIPKAPTIKILQSNITETVGGSVTSCALAFSTNVTAGSIIHAFCSVDGSSTSAISSVTDSQGNTYTQLGTGKTTLGGSGNSWAHFWGVAASSGSLTVTSHYNASYGYPGMAIYEIAGADTSGPMAHSEIAFAQSTYGTDGITSGSLTTGTNPCVAIAFCQDGVVATAPVAGTNYTADLSGPSFFTLTEYQYFISGSSEVITFSSSSNVAWDFAGVIYKQASSAPTGSAAIVEGADTVSGTGAVTDSGSAAIVEGHDTVAGTGSAGMVGSAAIVEGADTVSGTGSLTDSGSAAIAEGHDTVAGTGAVTDPGTGAITEGHDTVAGSGGTSDTGIAAIVEPPDTISGAGSVRIVGSAAVAEGADVASGHGSASSGQDVVSFSFTRPPTEYLYAKFVPGAVYNALVAPLAGNAFPRIWPPVVDVIVRIKR